MYWYWVVAGAVWIIATVVLAYYSVRKDKSSEDIVLENVLALAGSAAWIAVVVVTPFVGVVWGVHRFFRIIFHR